MRAGRTKVQRYRARLILEWMMKWGFDFVRWDVAIGYFDETISQRGWDALHAVQTTKTLIDESNGYRLDRDKATRYLEKYGS